MTKILVTGGAGFIGSHVVDGYIDAGHEVVIVDNLASGKLENVNKKASFYQMDITDTSKIDRIFETERFDIVNHHAAQIDVRKSVLNPVFDANTNILGLLNLLENCVKYKIKKFIFVSSGGVIYSDDAVLPIQEESAKNPISPYGITKLTSEFYLGFYSKVHGLPFTSLRYSNVYGPRQNPQGEAGVIAIFSNLMLQENQPIIYGDGNKTRDYVYVKDVLNANLLALEKGDNGAYNIGTGVETSVNELFSKLKMIIGYRQGVKYENDRPGELLRNSLNVEKAKHGLNWVPKYDLESGLKETVEWLKSKNSNYDNL